MAGHFISREFGDIEAINQPRLFQVTQDAKMLTHCGWQEKKNAAATVIVAHGLEGSSSSKYALGSAIKAYQAGFNVVRINQRGCGDTFHLSPTPYHAGLTNDLRAIIDELVLNDGISSIYLVGFSLGGNQSLKLAGEYGDAPPPALRGVCAVSVPIDLSICADSLHWAENWLYEWNFLYSLYNSYRSRQKLHPDRYKLPPASRVLTLRKFDDLITGPCNGFRDACDYYEKSSAAQFLKKIHIPTLIIQAKDDPFIPFAPFLATPMSDWVKLLATNEGGHVGYIGKDMPDEDRFWVENRAIEFFKLLNK
jgi:predicted alpha/beta-fold hydrolase